MTKEKEFVLSDKRLHAADAWTTKESHIYWIQETHVKEFIRLEMFLLEMYWKKEITFHEFIVRRNKLAGEELSR